jgi:hypothetical protein
MSVGFLDKVKEQGTALAAKAQEGVKQGQAKLDDGQARKKADGQLHDLGAWLWAQKNDRDDGQGDAEVSRLLGELSAFEAEHGALPLPVILPAGGEFNLETLDDSAAPPPPSAAAAAPPPPAAEGAAPPPPAPAAPAAPAPPAPAAAPPPPAATPPPAAPAAPPGGFTLEDF